jgi:ribosomal protein S12 methylthiotransferase accessory factor
MTWSRPGAVSLSSLRSRYPLARLVRPRVGLVDECVPLWQEYGVPRFEIATAELDNLTMTFPYVVGRDGGDVRDTIIGGAGSDLEPEITWVKAVAEAAERYATIAFDERDFVVASGDELGDAAIDLDRIPRCSARELADPRCPLRAPDRAAPIRWVRGWSLTARRERYVPAIMTHLYLTPRPEERFWIPISTGVATHVEPSAALVSAICEGIERDAIARTWLGRRPLASLTAPTDADGRLGEALRRVRASHVTQELYDATTELGVPTVLSLQRAPGHATCKIAVTCATAPTVEEAIVGAIREAAPSRAALAAARDVPADVADFHDLVHGAVWHGRRDDLSAFAFLRESGRSVATSDIAPICDSAAPSARLRALLARLDSLGMEAIALDLTTDELRDAGLWVVRVVIPELVPISFVHRARYLGTPRLAAELAEHDVNPDPLPFA